MTIVQPVWKWLSGFESCPMFQVPMKSPMLSTMDPSLGFVSLPEVGRGDRRSHPLPAFLLAPVSGQHEGGPGGGGAEAPLPAQGELRLAQGGGGRPPLPPEGAVEAGHELGRRPVLHPPEAREHPRRSGVLE